MGGFHGGHSSSSRSSGGFHGGSFKSSNNTRHTSYARWDSSADDYHVPGAFFVHLIVLIIKFFWILFGLKIDERKPLHWKQFLAIAISATSVFLLFFFFGLGVKVTGHVTNTEKYDNYNEFLSEYPLTEIRKKEYFTVEYEMYGKVFSTKKNNEALVTYSYGYITSIDYSVKDGEPYDIYVSFINPKRIMNSYNIPGYIIAGIALIVAFRFYILIFKERQARERLLLRIGDINGDGIVDNKDILKYNQKLERAEILVAKDAIKRNPNVKIVQRNKPIPTVEEIEDSIADNVIDFADSISPFTYDNKNK